MTYHNKAIAAMTSILIVAMIMTTPLSAFADSVHSAPRIKLKEGTSSNWSGYASVSNISSPASNYVKTVQGSWIIPTLTCGSSTTYSSAWVGIDGYSDNSVEQIGTEQDCSNGAQQNYAWFEMYPHPSFKITGITVHAGDVFNAKVAYIGNSKFQLSITDATTGKSYSNTFKAKAQRSSAEWVVEAPYSGGILPLANFGTMNFTNAQFNDSSGNAIAIDGKGTGTYDQITMHDPNGGSSTPSALTDSGAASSFSVTYSP